MTHAAPAPVQPAAGGEHAPGEVLELARALEDAAAQVIVDLEGARERATALAARAVELDQPGLEQLAQLVLAEVVGQSGETAASAITARAALAWGTEHDDAYVRSRALRLLSKFYDRLGDGAAALEHAVASLEQLPAHASPLVRASHETSLGLVYMNLSALDDARERFQRIMVVAEELDDDGLRLRTLNNLAFVAHLAGDLERSARLVDELLALAARTGLPLSAAAADTVARAQMAVGQHDRGLATLQAALADRRRITEADDVAFLHVTIAECLRELGRFDEARASLDVADEQCTERDLDGVRQDALAGRAALAAAAGDYRSAYELHLRYHEARVAQLAEAKDARARVLAAVFDTDEAVRASRRYRDESLRDHLTGLGNRRWMDAQAPRLLRSAAREGAPLTLAIADLDHFKRVNDTCSHQVGDVVLQRFAQLLAAACPSGGLAARLGGEEFVLVLPGHDAAAGARVAEQLVRSVREHDFSDVVGSVPVTVSVGAATLEAGGAERPLDALLGEADHLLYEAKRGGRDRAVTAPSGVGALSAAR